MELKEYLKIIKKNSKLILSVAIITALSAFLFSVLQPAKFKTSLSLFVNKNRTQETDDFKYDGYYALQAGEMITGFIEQRIKSPEAVSAIYQEAGVKCNFKSLKSYTKKFTVKRMSTQYVEVEFKTNSEEDAKKISAAIVKMVKSEVKKFGEDSEQELSFSTESGDPMIIKDRPNIFFNLIIGLISGFALGIFLVFGKEYFKKSF